MTSSRIINRRTATASFWLVIAVLTLSACNVPGNQASQSPGQNQQGASTQQDNHNPKASTSMACSKDAKICPDGITQVSRDPNNNCEFFPCPKPESSPMPDKNRKDAGMPPANNQPATREQVFCPQDVRQCPDGSWVGRDPDNNCRFRPCPDGKLPGNISQH